MHNIKAIYVFFLKKNLQAEADRHGENTFIISLSLFRGLEMNIIAGELAFTVGKDLK